MVEIVLRDVVESDLPIFFEHHQDKDALYMAAFTPPLPIDKAALMSHWRKIFADESNVNKTILYDGQVVGHILCFEMFGERNVGYWLDRAYWGKGIATVALKALLDIVTIRPLHARVVKDNKGSIRVLEKCGFVIIDEDTGFANARGSEVEEYILKLEKG
jgi:RimJ/RimL family protein N-acetyltransferase